MELKRQSEVTVFEFMHATIFTPDNKEALYNCIKDGICRHAGADGQLPLPSRQTMGQKLKCPIINKILLSFEYYLS